MSKNLLIVAVKGAKDLKDTDLAGKSDPYAIVKFEDDQGIPSEAKTHTIQGTLNPVWDVFFPFIVSNECSSYKVTLYDEDVGSDDKLGHANILRKDEDERFKMSGDWYYLESGKGGTVEVYQQEYDISNGLEEIFASKKEQISAWIASKKRANNYLMSVRIHGAKGLKSGFIDKSDPYAWFDFSEDPVGNGVFPEHARTRTIENNPSPVWEEQFTFIIPSGLKSFQIKVFDEDVGKDDSLGHVSVIVPKLGEHVQNKRLAVSTKGEVEISVLTIPIAPLLG